MKRGNASLRVRITEPGEAGAFALVPTPELLDRELVGPVTGILQGDFRFSVAVRGSPRTAGKVLRVQLNEYGGGRDDRVIASRSVRLARNWRTVSARGRVADDDGSGISALAVLERAGRGDAFYIDDFLVSGTPRARFEPTASTRRWAWWSYGLVWAAVAASGLAWIVYSRRSSTETGSAETG